MQSTGQIVFFDPVSQSGRLITGIPGIGNCEVAFCLENLDPSYKDPSAGNEVSFVCHFAVVSGKLAKFEYASPISKNSNSPQGVG